MTIRYYSTDAEPVDVDPVDVDGVVNIGLDWSDWLSGQELSAIDESTWHGASGVAFGDGVSTVVRKGKTVTPAGPAISAGVATVGLYVDGGVDGDRVIVSNHIRAGDVSEERSLAIRIREM